MAKIFRLNILTPLKSVYSNEVSSLIVPAELGYLGVLANHAPLITTLTQGKIIIKETSGMQIIFHSKARGLLEVLKNKVTILLEEISS